MKTKLLRSLICLVLVLASLTALALTDEEAAALAARFVPPAVTRLASPPFEDSYLQDALSNPLQQIQFAVGHLRYLAFTMPGDTDQYVLLGWGADREMYWRLLKSADGGKTYVVWQDAPLWVSLENWNFRLQDLTKDGVPEILIESDETLNIYAWRSGHMQSITPIDENIPAASGPFAEGRDGFDSNNGIFLEDVDGDGIAEVVQNAVSSDEPDENGDYTPRYISPTMIFKYDGSKYVLWKEIPAEDHFPVTVPPIGAVHPGTISFSELSSPGKGDLQVFVSHPAGTSTVDDIDTSSFTYNGAALSFKKRWPNQKQPDTASANWEWEGCPVKQTAPKGQGEWNPSPEDPYLPSPDGKTEYHFVAPYLEFRLPRSAVFPYLLQAATDTFAKEPDRQTYFIEIPISGKMKNGKLAAVSALVCIKNTGNADKTASPPATPTEATFPEPARKP